MKKALKKNAKKAHTSYFLKNTERGIIYEVIIMKIAFISGGEEHEI